MKIPVTLLSTYLYCSRKLFLQRVLRMEEPDKESLVIGSIRHEIHDMMNKDEEHLVISITKEHGYEAINSMYRENYARKAKETILKNRPRIREAKIDIVDAFKKTWPPIMQEAEERAENIHSFIKKNNVYGAELWEKLTPKILSEFKVESDALQLKGTIDRVELYTNGCIPIELKTGKMPKEGIWPGHRVQIAAYALLLEEALSMSVKEGFVNYLDSKEKRHLSINPFMREEVLNLVREVQELLENRSLPDYTENRNKCTSCGLRSRCHDEEEMNLLVSEHIRSG